MNVNATVRTADLEQTLDLLEGLQLIMRSFHEVQRGRSEPDALLETLQSMDSHGQNWQALRYQTEVGQGWDYIATSITELRTRLLAGYADAAL